MQVEPALAQHSEHAHGLNGLGVVQVAAGQLAGLLRIDTGLSQGLAGHEFVDAGQADQQHGTGRGQHTKPDVERIDHTQINRKPRRIEEREQRGAGDKLTDQGQIP